MNRALILALGTALCAVPVALTGPAAAQPKAAAPYKAPRDAEGHPDLSGFWDLDTKVPRDAALMKRIGPNTAVLDDTGPVEFPREKTYT